LKPLLIVIGGPTGIGKTSVAINIAQNLGVEIVSADSRQIFKELSIGTAVPSNAELSQVKHHFIQTHSVKDNYNASKYETEALLTIEKLFEKYNKVVLVGGSGLYIDAVCNGIDELPTISKEVREKFNSIFINEGIVKLQEMLKIVDPGYYEEVDKKNHKRLLKALEVYEITGKPYSTFLKKESKERSFDIVKIVLDIQREELYDRINKRVDKMVGAGLEDEAKRMVGLRHLTPLKTVGYREFFDYFDGKISKEEAVVQIKNHTRAYARRQLTWFRRYKDAHWFSPDQVKEINELINSKKVNDN